MRRIAIVLTIGMAALAMGGPARAALPATCPPPGSSWNGNNPWCYDWQGQWQQQALTVPSADGPLSGTIFAPTRLAAGVRLPAIAVLHGLSGKQTNMWWLTRYLAGHAYIALAVCGVWGIYGAVYFMRASKSKGKPVYMDKPAMALSP